MIERGNNNCVNKFHKYFPSLWKCLLTWAPVLRCHFAVKWIEMADSAPEVHWRINRKGECLLIASHTHVHLRRDPRFPLCNYYSHPWRYVVMSPADITSRLQLSWGPGEINSFISFSTASPSQFFFSISASSVMAHIHLPSTEDSPRLMRNRPFRSFEWLSSADRIV